VFLAQAVLFRRTMIRYTLYDINKHEVLDLQDNFIEEAVKSSLFRPLAYIINKTRSYPLLRLFGYRITVAGGRRMVTEVYKKDKKIGRQVIHVKSRTNTTNVPKRKTSKTNS
jgi:hypothetical protein